MNTLDRRLLELHVQRGRLQERIATQRTQLAQQWAPVGRVLHVARSVRLAVRAGIIYLLQHPLAASATLAGIVLLKPRSVWRWGVRGLFVWRSWRALHGAAAKFL